MTATKTRTKWDADLISQALILLKTHDANHAAKKLNVSVEAMRKTLARHNISLRQYRKIWTRRASALHSRSKGRSAFIKPNEFKPFIAMAAFEADIGGCRWPIGDLDKECFRFCCHEIARKSYCKAHAKIAYISAPAMPLNSWEAYQKAETSLRAKHAAECRAKMC